MREIKFRAWQSKKKKMYIQGDAVDENRKVFWDKWENSTHISDPMQFTGLMDKNDKEIYEGDIVESNTTSFLQYEFAEVRFSNGGFQFYLPNGRRVENVDTTCYSIIGNIYENPELLV